MSIRSLLVVAAALFIGSKSRAAEPAEAEHALSETLISAKLPEGFVATVAGKKKTYVELRKPDSESRAFVSNVAKQDLSDFRNYARVVWEGRAQGFDTIVEDHNPKPYAETFDKPVLGYRIWKNDKNEKLWFGAALLHGPDPVMVTIYATDADSFKALAEWSKTVRAKAAAK